MIDYWPLKPRPAARSECDFGTVSTLQIAAAKARIETVFPADYRTYLRELVDPDGNRVVFIGA